MTEARGDTAPGGAAGDEFYTGYLPEAPAGIAARVRRAVIAVFLAGAAVALLLVFGQGGFSAAAFEFGVVRDFEGVVRAAPVPTLEVERPGAAGGRRGTSRYYLVMPGKHGAGELVAAYGDRRVRLRGTLVYRDGQTLIEVVPGSPAALASEPAAAAAESLGTRTLYGRIVDSKCHLGVMKPGDGKPHRACASLCIRGGIPPLFLVRGERGAATLLLVGADGRALNSEVLELVDEPLEITGEVVRYGDRLVLRADPATYRRL